MNKQDLIRKIKEIDALSNEEKSELIELVNTQKRYGLVWEDKPEEVEEELREKLPVLVEVKERAILAENLSEDTPEEKTGELFDDEELEKPKAPNHILIEGDNLHALTVLNYTHAGKIDAMYFDPPYNIGNNDFIYNDKYVDKEDAYKHSKWLSFMNKRLKLAKNLLSENGVLFISIDDNEQAQLRLLCDEIFSEENFVADIIWEKKYSPQNDAKWFSPNHDYILVYAKNKLKWRPNLLERNEEQNARYKNPDNDPRGDWKMSDLSVKTYSAEYDYPITTPSGRIAKLPPGRCWMTNKMRMNELIADNRIWFGKNGDNIPALKRFLSEVKQGVTPLTIWFRKDVGDNQEGKQELIQILPENLFQTPKVVRLIKKIIKLSTKKDSIILDIFAGSGTTLHATMQLNDEDRASRQCILVTNNENQIAEKVCYERNKRVILGYTKTNGQNVEGLNNNNFRYYKTDFISRDKTSKNKRKLTELATDMLCIKEDCFHSITNYELQITKGKIRLFENDSFFMMIILDEDYIEKSIEIIRGLEKKVKVYIFSPGQYPFTDDFEEVLDKVELCALPEAIYKAYKSILPKKKIIEYEDNVYSEEHNEN